MKVKIINRSDNYVGYSIPDMNLVRNFAPNEDKLVDSIEIEKLAYQAGGQELIDGYFMIENEDLATQISPSFAKEPEYKYTIEDVKYLVKNASIDEFLDALDFAPAGTIETIKSVCATMPVTNTEKIKIMKDRFGIDLSNIIENIKEEEASSGISNGKIRRTSGITNTENTEYKVIRRVEK